MARATPTALAHELGIRPQVIYGLIKRGKVHAYGQHPQMIDVGEVKHALANTRTRVPKEKKESAKARVPTGSILSTARDFKGPKAKQRTMYVATGILDSDEPDGTDFLVFADGSKRVIDMFSTADMGEMLTKRFAQIHSPEAVLGMLVFHFQMAGDVDRASALEEFSRLHLDIVPVKYEVDPQATVVEAKGA